MPEILNRRNFLKKSVAASAGVTLGLSLEEKILLAGTAKKPIVPVSESSVKDLPIGRIGDVNPTFSLKGVKGGF